MVTEYIPENADSVDEIEQYYLVRSLEMNADIVELVEQPDYTFKCILLKDNEIYHSIYIPYSVRGLGLIKNYFHLNFLTITDCGIVELLEEHNGNYRVIEGWFEYDEYRQLKSLLGNSKDNNGNFLMHQVTKTCNAYENSDRYSDIQPYLKNTLNQL